MAQCVRAAAPLVLGAGRSPRPLLSSSRSVGANLRRSATRHSSTSRNGFNSTGKDTDDGSYKMLFSAVGVAGVWAMMLGGETEGLQGHPVALCAEKKAAHILLVTGSNSGTGMREAIIASPKEVPIPGAAGAIDSVAFGPEWVVIAKQGRVLVSEGPGKEAVEVYKPSSGWLFGGSGYVTQVASSSDTVYALTSNGAVLYWKVARGTDPAPQQLAGKAPSRFSELRGHVVTQVAAGPEHAVFVTKKGDVLGLGENRDGRVGVGGEDQGPVRAPTMLKLPEGKPVVKAACGGSHTLLVDYEGTVWSCGSDDWYQLGHGESWKVVKEREIAVIREPKKVRHFETPVLALAAGGSHSLFSLGFEGFRIEKGAFDERIKIPARVLETWATGFGQYGQLGDRAYVHLSPLRQIKELRILTPPDVKLPVTQVACGDNHSAVLVWEAVPVEKKQQPAESRQAALEWPKVTYRPQVYVFGHNLGGQCGTGKAGNVGKVTVPQGVKASLVDMVVCGYDWSGFVQRVEQQ